MSEADAALRRALDALSRYYIGGRSLEDTLGAVARLALEAVDAADFIALIVAVERRPMTTFFTDQRAYELDQVQYRVDSGPCLDAYRDGTTYVIPSTRDGTRWPEFASAASRCGVGSTLSVPLGSGGMRLGAMNLYSEQERSFGESEQEVAHRFAGPASVMLANAAAYANALALGENLTQAMESRATIEQAKGIIMAGMRCSAEEAFELLVQQSQQQNIKVRLVADEIVRNASRRP